MPGPAFSPYKPVARLLMSSSASAIAFYDEIPLLPGERIALRPVRCAMRQHGIDPASAIKIVNFSLPAAAAILSPLKRQRFHLPITSFERRRGFERHSQNLALLNGLMWLSRWAAQRKIQEACAWRLKILTRFPQDRHAQCRKPASL
jgi:hypothetical protein